MTFFDVTPMGRILHRFSKDLDTLDNVMPGLLRFWFPMFISVRTVNPFLNTTSGTIKNWIKVLCVFDQVCNAAIM